MDFELSEKGQDFYNRVRQFMKDEIEPVEPEYLRELRSLDNPGSSCRSSRNSRPRRRARAVEHVPAEE